MPPEPVQAIFPALRNRGFDLMEAVTPKNKCSQLLKPHGNGLAALSMAVALAACGRSAELVPLNAEATAIGIPKMDVTLYGTGYGPATVTLPNGEILAGHYRLAIGGAVSSGFASVSGPRGYAVANGTAVTTQLQNPFMLQATGANGASMVCSGSAGGLGHGDALCTMNSGAQYQMMF